MGLWTAVFQRQALLIDIGLISVLGGFHVVAWVTLPTSRFDPDPQRRSHASLHSATNAGMTVAGILIPLALLAVTLGTGGSAAFLSPGAAVDLLAAGGWLFISLFCALLITSLMAFEASDRSIYARKDIGILAGLQLIFLLVGMFRVVWGLASVVTEVVR